MEVPWIPGEMLVDITIISHWYHPMVHRRGGLTHSFQRALPKQGLQFGSFGQAQSNGQAFQAAGTRNMAEYANLASRWTSSHDLSSMGAPFSRGVE